MRHYMAKTKRQIESEISEAIIMFEKDYMGRGPVETRTYLINDLVTISKHLLADANADTTTKCRPI